MAGTTIERLILDHQISRKGLAALVEPGKLRELQRQYLDWIPAHWLEARSEEVGRSPLSAASNDLISLWMVSEMPDQAVTDIILPLVADHPVFATCNSPQEALAQWRGLAGAVRRHAMYALRAPRSEATLPTQPMSTGTVRAILKDHFGAMAIETLERAGQLHLIDSVSDLPDDIQARYSTDLQYMAAATLASGEVFMLASRMRPAQVPGIFLHEMGEHASLATMLGADYGRLVANFRRLLGKGDAYASYAAARVPRNTPASVVPSEQLAYLVEKVANDQVAAPGGEEGYKLGQQCLSQLRTWIFRTPLCRYLDTLNVTDKLTLTPADLASLAREATGYAVRQHAADAPLQEDQVNQWFDLLDQDLLDYLYRCSPDERRLALAGESPAALAGYLYGLSVTGAPRLGETLDMFTPDLARLATGEHGEHLQPIAGELLEQAQALMTKAVIQESTVNHGMAMWYSGGESPSAQRLHVLTYDDNNDVWRLKHYRKGIGTFHTETFNSAAHAVASLASNAVAIHQAGFAEALESMRAVNHSTPRIDAGASMETLISQLGDFHQKDDHYQFDNYLLREELINALVDRAMSRDLLTGATLPTGSGTVTIAPSAQVPGSWQVTFFDEDEQPTGDYGYQTREEALRFFFESVRPDLVDSAGYELHRERARQPVTETPEFQRWFKNSRVVSPDGKPLVVYRGQHGDSGGDIQTHLGSITFTCDPGVASLYAQEPNNRAITPTAENPTVIPAYLSLAAPVIDNPYDPFADLDALIPKLGQETVAYFARKYSEHIENTGVWAEDYADYEDVDHLLREQPNALEKLYLDAYVLLDDSEFVAVARSAGFDGAIHMGNGESAEALEYRVFDKRQIKSVNNTGSFDPANDDIRYSAGIQLQTDTPEFKRWFANSQVVDADGNPLILYHGTNQDFTAFNPEASREGDQTLFATNSYSVASAFALYRSVWNGANIMPIYVKADQVLEVDGNYRPIREVEDSARLDGMQPGESLRGYARRMNYDAICIRNTVDDVGPDMVPTSDVYILMPSAQIKSALGNIGTFDASNPDIRYSMTAPVATAAGRQYVPSYHLQGWMLATNLPQETLEKYARLGELQRGAPENAMLAVQNALGGSPLHPVVEHIGDLTNRMSPKHDIQFAYEETRDKIERQLLSLKSGYGFRRDYEESLESAARYRGLSVEEYTENVNRALDAYANAHAALETYTPLQTMARDAAVALGRREFEKATQLLEQMLAGLDSFQAFVVGLGGEPGVTRTPAFQRWFGNSLVTDDDGRPQIMYHGSYQNLTWFDRQWSTNVRRTSMDNVGSWFTDNPGLGGAEQYANGEGAVIYPVYLSITRPKIYDQFDDFLRDMHEANGDRLEDMSPKGVGSPEALREKLKLQGYDGIAFTKTNIQALHQEVKDREAAVALAQAEYQEAIREAEARGMEFGMEDGRPYQSRIDRLAEALQQARRELAEAGTSTEFDQQYVWVAFEPEQIKSAIGNIGTFDPTNADIRFWQRDAAEEAGRSSYKAFDPDLINEQQVPGYKSRDKLIEMPIADFLALAREGYGEEKESNVQSLLAAGTPFNSLPHLNISKDGRVEGHEGRHRARALAQRGYVTMPVLLRMEEMRWSEQRDPARRDYIANWPAALQAEEGAANPNFSIPFPVSRHQAMDPYNPGTPAASGLRTPGAIITRYKELVADGHPNPRQQMIEEIASRLIQEQSDSPLSTSLSPEKELAIAVRARAMFDSAVDRNDESATQSVRFTMAMDILGAKLFGIEAAALKERIEQLSKLVEQAYESGDPAAEDLDVELETAQSRLEDILSEMEEDGPTLGDGQPGDNPLLLDSTDIEVSLEPALANIYRQAFINGEYIQYLDDEEKAEFIRGQVGDLAEPYGGLKDGVTDQQLLDLIAEAYESAEGKRRRKTNKLVGVGRSLTELLSHMDREQAFKAWFGQSRVVNPDGSPKVVYHGTGASFSVFSEEHFGESTGMGDWGEGFYFTDRPEVAGRFAEVAHGDNPNIMPVHLMIENPATNEVLMSDSVQDALQDDMGFESVRDILAEMGYDGIIWDHKNDGGIEYVVFHPEQIKSAIGNRGTFDSQNPDIRFSRSGVSQSERPAPLSPDAIVNTPSFKRWFGDSKVVDEKGEPLVVYHGTAGDFSEFSKLVRAKHIDLPGFYFTPQTEYADRYAESAGREFRDEDGFIAGSEGANVMPVYLSLQNPAEIDVGGANAGLVAAFEIEEMIKSAQFNGHDGVILKGWADGSGPIQYIAFNPEQIKSAIGNVGTFDPSNPDIRFSRSDVSQSERPAPLSADSIVNTPSFKRWFGDSKVVDAEGKPLVVYHGTTGDFDAFRDDIEGRAGFYFTDDKAFANSFADGDGANVLPSYLSIKNPADMRSGVPSQVENALDSMGYSRLDELLGRDPREVWNHLDGDRELSDMLQRAGYDGLRLAEPEYKRNVDSWVAFRPEQIKSAVGNNGDFDPTNPDIRFSQSGTDDKTAHQDTTTSSQAFKRWFGNSKVVDAEGSPLRVYHGSDSKFTQFEIGRANGIYFTPNKGLAELYGPHITEAYLKIEMLADLTDPSSEAYALAVKAFNDAGGWEHSEDAMEDRESAMFDPDMDETWELFDNPEADIARVLQDAGYDGAKLAEYNGDVSFVVFQPEQIKSAIDNRGTFDSQNSDIRFTFAGAGAATASIEALNTAIEMQERGEPNQQIYVQTGWYKGLDGRWRYEISDDQARFRDATHDLDSLWDDIKADVTLDMDGKLHTATYKEGTAEHVRGFGHTEEDAKRNLAIHLAKSRHGSSFNIKEIDHYTFYKVKDILEHPELLTAYPALGEIKVQFNPAMAPSSAGSWSPSQGVIQLNPARSPAEMLSTLLHELQHVIQDTEDFATGGNEDATFAQSTVNVLGQLVEGRAREVEAWELTNESIIQEVDRAQELHRNALLYSSLQRLESYAQHDTPSSVFRLIRNELQWIQSPLFKGNARALEIERSFYSIPRRGPSRNEAIRALATAGAQLLRDTIPADQIQRFDDDPRTTRSLLAALDRERVRKELQLQPLQRLKNQLRDTKILYEATSKRTPYQIYRALAGEIESRATQARQHLTADERRKRPPAHDFDVPVAEAIVIVGGQEFQLPQAFVERLAPRTITSKSQGIAPEAAPVELVEFDELPTEVQEDLAYALIDSAAAEGVRQALLAHNGRDPDHQDILNELAGLADPIMLPQLTVTPESLSNLPDRSVSDRAVTAYRERLAAGEVPPPILVRRQGDELILVEGGHRAAAALQEGLSLPAVDVSAIFSMDWPAFLNGDAVVQGAPLRSMLQADKHASDVADNPAFRRWFADSKVVDAEGRPLVVYHGTAIPKTTFRRDGGAAGVGAYFTPYRAVAEDYAQMDVVEDGDQPEVMEVYLSIQNPYPMNGLESYSITPQRRDELEALGYDGVLNTDNGEIVAFRPEQIKSAVGNRGTFDPSNPDIRFSRTGVERAARGRVDGGDVAFSRDAITNTPAFKRWFGDSKVVDADGKPLVVYHGTDSVFTEFSQTGDIGYHFGTEIAARDRAARVGGAGVLVEPVTLSQVEKDSLAALNGEIGGTPAADLYALLLRKLDSPRQDLRAQVEAMPADEIKQVKAEYLEQPDSLRFAERVDRAKAGEGFRVEVNGETVSTHRTVREANARAARLREQAAKPMALYLRIENPIRLPDLGVWPAQEIAKEAGFSEQEMERVVEAGTAEQQYAAVRAILESKGFDGIVYRNEVEHAGEDSYIAFHPEQIKSAIGNRGTFDPSNPDIRFAFAGERSTTADTSLADRARAMADQSYSPDEIRLATGWFEGDDGLWRYEIDDSKATLSNDWVLMGSADDEHPLYALNGSLGSHVVTMNPVMAAVLGRTEGVAPGLLDHPELFQAYPQLAEIRVSIQRSSAFTQSSGQYTPRTRQIDVRIPAGREQELLSLLLHEVQHAIQHIEGFSPGGSPDMFDDQISDPVLHERLNNILDIEHIAKSLSITPDAVALGGSFDRVFAERVVHLVEQGQWESTVTMARNALMNPMAKYRRLAGEIEARNVQSRLHMTAEERMAVGPEATRDIPASESLVREYGKLGPQAFFASGEHLAFTRVPPQGAEVLAPVHLKMDAPFIDRAHGTLVSFGELQRAIGAARTFAFMLRMEETIYASASWKVLTERHPVSSIANLIADYPDLIDQVTLPATVLLNYPGVADALASAGHDGAIYAREDGEAIHQVFSADSVQPAPALPARELGRSILMSQFTGVMASKFQQWSEGSHVATEEGAPLVVFSVERMKDDITDALFQSGRGSKRFVNFAQAWDEAEQKYQAGHATLNVPYQVTPAYLAIMNPIPGITVQGVISGSDLFRIIETEQAERIIRQLGVAVTAGRTGTDDTQALANYYVPVAQMLDKPEWVEVFKRAGYDGALVPTHHDGQLTTEYRVFSPDQVLSGRSMPIITTENAGQGIRMSALESMVYIPQGDPAVTEEDGPVFKAQRGASVIKTTLMFEDIPGVVIDGTLESAARRAAVVAEQVRAQLAEREALLHERSSWVASLEKESPELAKAHREAVTEARQAREFLNRWNTPSRHNCMVWDAPLTNGVKKKVSQVLPASVITDGMTGRAAYLMAIHLLGGHAKAARAFERTGIVGMATPERVIMWDSRSRELARVATHQLEDARFHIAYHGSPHLFQDFSLEKVGTGEGAQAFGYGVYVADSLEVARHYQNYHSALKVLYENEVYPNFHALIEDLVPKVVAAHPEFDDYASQAYIEAGLAEAGQVIGNRLEPVLRHLLNVADYAPERLDGIQAQYDPELVAAARYIIDGIERPGAAENKRMRIMPRQGARGLREIAESSDRDMSFGLQELQMRLHWFVRNDMSDDEIQEALDSYIASVANEQEINQLIIRLEQTLEGDLSPGDREFHEASLRDAQWNLHIARCVQKLCEAHGPLRVMRPIHVGFAYMLDVDVTDDQYLMHDLPFSQQSELVQTALSVLARSDSLQLDQRTELAEKIAADSHGSEFLEALAGKSVFGNNDPDNARATALLLAHGVKGLKYADGLSRHNNTDATTFNYVVFDPADIKVLARTAVDPYRQEDILENPVDEEAVIPMLKMG